MKTVCIALLLCVLSLLNNEECVGQVYIQIKSNGVRQFRLNSAPANLGNDLKTLLRNELSVGSTCTIWADKITEISAANLKLEADHCLINFHNIVLKAPLDQPFDNVINLAGDGIRLTGAKIDGNGPAFDEQGKNTGRGEGVRIAGKDCQLIECSVSNMPDGSVANCFYIAGANSFVSNCHALNPGYACFRCVANNATFDRVEGRIDRPTRNGHNRLFNVDSNLAKKRGVVTIRNSRFYANFPDPNTPPNLTEVILNFDPGDGDEKGLDDLIIENCSIQLGEGVRSIRNHHVFKIKNITRSRLDRLTVITPKNYQGWTMRLQKTQADISMDCQVLNCHWDQGINFDAVLKSMTIFNCQLGKLDSYANELLNDVNFPETLLIQHTQLFHTKSLANLREKNDNCSLTFKDVSFTSNASAKNTFVFRSGVPARASFFNSTNFQFKKSAHSKEQHRLWLSYSPITRLALTSYQGAKNTLVFDPRLGTAKSKQNRSSAGINRFAKTVGPPFAGIKGKAGDKIFLAAGANPNTHGWQAASFWRWNSGNMVWQPSAAIQSTPTASP